MEDICVEGGVSAQPWDEHELLWSMVEGAAEELNAGQKEQFFALLYKYLHILSLTLAALASSNILFIQVTQPQSNKESDELMPHTRQAEVHQLLEEMVQQDVIQHSSSPWVSPIVLVKKKDGTTRFCVDYRRLNEATRKDAYPLPRIDITLDTLAGSYWFSTLDLLSGYWQVEIAEEDRCKTAFCTTEGLYEFKVMPFGLCNAPATFQRLMDLVLSGLQWSQCPVYLDDVIIVGRTFKEHLQNLDAVLRRIQGAGLKLKPGKCMFFQEKVNYLEHVISREGVTPDNTKIEKVASWPIPQSTRSVQQFLGFANYYRRFIKDFSTIAKPLHRLTERGANFKWTDACQAAFIKLRKHLSTPPFPDFSRKFILDMDASDCGIGGVLSQVDANGHERVIAYGSRLLSKPERQYCVTRRELLAVIVFTDHFRPYLIGQQFVLRTDHGSLTWLANFKEPTGQTARWMEKLQSFNFRIQHRQGKKHTNADALSRLPCKQCGRICHQDKRECYKVDTLNAVVTLVPPEDVGKIQQKDHHIGPVLRAKQEGQRPQPRVYQASSMETKRLFQIWDQLLVKNDCLYRLHRHPTTDMETLQLVIPRAKREEILRDMHEGSIGGHMGEEKTLGRLKERYYWPGHYADVRNWCATCVNCAARKSPAPKKTNPP